jgi:WD40 repeat protein
MGSAAIVEAIQSVRMTLNTLTLPFDSQRTFSDIAYSPDLRQVALIDLSDQLNPHTSLFIWDYQEQTMVTLPAGPGGLVAGWSPDGRFLLYQTQWMQASTGLDLWDIQNRRRVQHYADPSASLSSYPTIRWSPDGTHIAITGTQLTIFSASSLQPLFTLAVPYNLRDFAWSPDSRRLALLADAGTTAWQLQIWDLQSRQIVTERSFTGQADQERSNLAWSPGGTHLAVAMAKQLQLIPVTTPLGRYVLDQLDRVQALAWSPDGSYLAVSARKGKINTFCVWDSAKRSRVHVFMNNESAGPDELAWARDGKAINSFIEIYKRVSWPWP